MIKIPDANIQILFARSASRGRSAATDRPAIVIVPDHNDWNDFGYRLYANMHVLLAADEWLLSIRLMFGDEPRTADYLVKCFEQMGPVIDINDIPKPICSLLRETETYGKFVQALGFERAMTALRQLGDAVLLTLENEDSERLALINSERFHAAMLRNSEEYRAFRRGGRYLRPTPAPEVEDAAISFDLYPDLPGKHLVNPIEFDFEPDPLFDDRASVLVGRNGAGKTQSLLSLIDGLMKQDEADESEDLPLDPVPLFRRVLMFSSVPSDPYPKSILPWQGIDYEYHAVAVDTAPLGKSFLLSLIDCIRDDGALFGSEDERRDRHQLLRVTLRGLGVWSQLHVPLTLPDNDTEDQFSTVHNIDGTPYFQLSELRGEYRTAVFANRVDWSKPAITFDDLGQPRHLSSGELAMLQFAAQAIASIEQGSLLLLDEPETHLHPTYISKFMDLLQELLKRTQSIAIIATHSSYVVREVPRQRVSIFLDTEEGITIVRPRVQSFGANVDTLSQFIFGDTLISHRYQRVLRNWAEAQGRELGIQGVIDVHGKNLNPETLSFIARVIDEAKS